MLFRRWAELPSNLTAATRALVGTHVLAELLVSTGEWLTRRGIGLNILANGYMTFIAKSTGIMFIGRGFAGSKYVTTLSLSGGWSL